MHDVLIRDATEADANRVAEVHVRTWQAAYRGQIPDSYLAALDRTIDRRQRWWREAITSPASAAHRVLVAEAEGEVAGFVSFGPDRAEPSRGEVYAIYVHPRFWDRGVGRGLFARAAEQLRDQGFREAVLWVLNSNQRARRFYEAAGWSTDGGAKSEWRGDVELREVRYRTTLWRT